MQFVDTGIFVAAADRSAHRHHDCADVLRSHHNLAVPASVVPEAAWMIESRLGPAAEAQFLRVVTSTRFTIVTLLTSDYERIIELIETYADMGLGFVDASIVATAERLNVTAIATLNRRDFAVVRPNHVSAFHLIP